VSSASARRAARRVAGVLAMVVGLLHGFASPAQPEAQKLTDIEQDAGPQCETPSVAQRVADLRNRGADYRKRGFERAARAVEREAAKLQARSAPRTAEARALDRAAKLARLRQLHERYGDKLREPAMARELAVHGRRAARLGRIKALASLRPRGEEKKVLLARIDQVIRKEGERHRLVMQTLASEASAGHPPDAQDQRPNATE
jgi:hypothetical protein